MLWVIWHISISYMELVVIMFESKVKQDENHTTD